jgi:hypothetical protein
MAKIDTGPQPIFHVGDNRHSPLRIVDAALHPYLPRGEENRKHEAGLAPRRGIKTVTQARIKDAAEKLKVRSKHRQRGSR